MKEITIEYRGIPYACRVLTVTNFWNEKREYIFAPVHLEDSLQIHSDIGGDIDGLIYYYLTPEEMKLSDIDLFPTVANFSTGYKLVEEDKLLEEEKTLEDIYKATLEDILEYVETGKINGVGHDEKSISDTIKEVLRGE